ncbi:FAD-dependent tricarballylate dehydrogenase TcuA [Siccirubricoccus phaeus]|uniref:FAD-dependent tricarballylate dehydrogenase TcuA n=1 Tax=Siccirubricoccus phaeus TaxID=2595053 RepID=UPI0011F0DEC6|nr:FAD-dependent tricarballylate dehydrogenase TcuA [Siccirubricoccus phaeus]
MSGTAAYDVIVVGAGNAALCAALSAREQGARVLVLEKASQEERGGNSTFTAGGFRFVHDGLDDLRRDVLVDLSEAEAARAYIPPLPAELYMHDLQKVTEGLAQEELAGLLIGRSRETVVWMRQQGVRFIPMFGRQSYLVNGKHHFYGGVNIEAVGGGWGLVDFLVKAAEKAGIEIRYDTGLRRLLQDRKGAVTGVTVFGPEGYEDIAARAVVLACGGFESNPEMRTRYLGPGWELCRVRGTRHNTGDGIRAALEIGAQAFGGWSTCHAVQWDISAPPYGDRVVLDNFQKHSYPLGIVVNLAGERFVDEGADFRNHTYAKYGREVMKQPQRTAVQIFDSQTIKMVRDEYRIRQVTKAEANSIEELATALDIDPVGLARTVQAYNAACQPGDYNPAILDGKRTEGISPPKSNWALPLNEPPYYGFVVTCGITFTFGGLRITTRGEVQDTSDRPIPGLYAAGELVGGIFYQNYLGGAGLMSGSVFGRLAGGSAAQHARAATALAAE